MKIIHALEPLEKSIFLAGPTPRDEAVASWRPEALALLEKLGFSGSVLVPEARDWAPHHHYDDQVFWEWEGLASATVVVFWVPRQLDVFPAFTTNVEYGLMAHSGKCILGYPPEAAKMSYLDHLAKRYAIPVFSTLHQTLAAAVARCAKPYSV